MEAIELWQAKVRDIYLAEGSLLTIETRRGWVKGSDLPPLTKGDDRQSSGRRSQGSPATYNGMKECNPDLTGYWSVSPDCHPFNKR